MASRNELQYYSPGRQIYYWFGEAYGLTGNQEAGHDILFYLGTEARVKEALFKNIPSKYPKKNEILQRELAAAPEHYKNTNN